MSMRSSSSSFESSPSSPRPAPAVPSDRCLARSAARSTSTSPVVSMKKEPRGPPASSSASPRPGATSLSISRTCAHARSAPAHSCADAAASSTEAARGSAAAARPERCMRSSAGHGARAAKRARFSARRRLPIATHSAAAPRSTLSRAMYAAIYSISSASAVAAGSGDWSPSDSPSLKFQSEPPVSAFSYDAAISVRVASGAKAAVSAAARAASGKNGGRSAGPAAPSTAGASRRAKSPPPSFVILASKSSSNPASPRAASNSGRSATPNIPTTPVLLFFFFTLPCKPPAWSVSPSASPSTALANTSTSSGTSLASATTRKYRVCPQQMAAS
mmetsp:Transcript_20001/g.49681  ORF Transcript_20001/g.49681 Transcript_20001/m.49681 type:complete len:332 (-) Transcript_20001:1270-2265(-)